MKGPLTILVLALLGLGWFSATSCLVTRRSESYTCRNDDDCDNGRACEDGYCVQNPCPSQCSSCDLSDGTCEIACSANKPCGPIQCPKDFFCTIQCSSANACGDIDCAPGNGCDITCGGMGSCRAINCGTKACDIDCNGPASCPSIDCANSCRCNVDCNNTNTICPSIACPLSDLGTPCTENAVAGEVCEPLAAPGCDRCR